MGGGLSSPKVAIVTNSLYGGVWTSARFVMETLERSGRFEYDVISVATSAHDEASVRILDPRSWRRGIRVIEQQMNGVKARHVGAQFTELETQRYRPRKTLTNLLDKYDLVQVVSGTPPLMHVTAHSTMPKALLVASRTTVERATVLKQAKGLSALFRRLMAHAVSRMEADALRTADVVFVLNKWMEEYAIKEISAARTIFAPPGIDTAFWWPQPYQPDGYILCVGRLADPRKNIPLLLTAYRQLLDMSDTAPRLVLAGRTAPSADTMAHLEQLGLSDRVEIIVNPSLERLRSIYQHAAMFVLSSDEEGLGLVILEAMACGIPVVSTDSGGPATLIDNHVTGIMTPVGDAEALANTMRELLADPKRRAQMGEAGRKRAEHELSLEATGDLYLAKYDELLQSKA